jgi:hypothetical protein
LSAGRLRYGNDLVGRIAHHAPESHTFSSFDRLLGESASLKLAAHTV